MTLKRRATSCQHSMSKSCQATFLFSSISPLEARTQLGSFKAVGSFTVSLFARTQSSIGRVRVEVAPRTALVHALTTIHATAASITL